MARLTILVAVFAVLLLVVDASIYRTTITTTEVDEGLDYTRPSQRCRREIQRQDLSQCRQYLRQGSQGDLMFRGVPNTSNVDVQQCCQQLRQVNEDCQCEAIKRMVNEQEQQQEGEYQEMREVRMRAQSLPSRCSLSPSQQQCDVSSV